MLDVCVYTFRSTVGNLEGILCVHMNDAFCDGSGLLFSKALSKLCHRFPLREWQVGEGMSCGSEYAQDKVDKEITITQTEFAVEITKVPMSPARKKMQDDLADENEI